MTRRVLSKEGLLSVNEVKTSGLSNSLILQGADKGLLLDEGVLDAADSRDALDAHRTFNLTSGTRSFPSAPWGTIERSRFVGDTGVSDVVRE